MAPCRGHPLPDEDWPESYGTWEDGDAEAKGTLRSGGVEPSGAAQNKGQGNQNPNESVNPDKGHEQSGNRLDHRDHQEKITDWDSQTSFGMLASV